MSMRRPPHPQSPGRSHRIGAYPGKPRKVEAWVSLVSWIHATLTFRLKRRADSSVYPDIMPLALYCRKNRRGGSEDEGGVGPDVSTGLDSGPGEMRDIVEVGSGGAICILLARVA